MFIGTSKTYQGTVLHKVFFNMGEGAIGAILFSRTYDFTDKEFSESFEICTVYLKGETVSEDAGFEIDINMGWGILAKYGYEDINSVPRLAE